VLVFGRDSQSGVTPGPVAPLSVSFTKCFDDDDEHNGGKAELRTYKVVDLAGNSLLLVEKVKKKGQEIKVEVVSLQYNGGPLITPPKNTKNFEWATDKRGSIKELEQKMTVGTGKDKQEVEAKYEAKKNQTTIKIHKANRETKVVKTGLVLLRMATDRGKLTIEY